MAARPSGAGPRRLDIPYYRSLAELVAPPASALPLAANDPIYAMAQQVCWLDDAHFAVGRWSGVASIFDAADPHPRAPVAEAAIVPPTGRGIEMLAAGDGSWFVSSNDERSITVWSMSSSGGEVTTELGAVVTYDPSIGTANCGLYTPTASGSWLVTGHESGQVVIWDAADPAAFVQQVVVDLASDTPTNPWGLQNIRSVQPFDIGAGNATVVTGSENGDICLLGVPSGSVFDTTVYNPGAQRGINTVATSWPWILVGNCAVGAADKNLWCFRADDASIQPTSSVNLVVDPSLPQVFDFSVSFVGALWYAATEEGALWGGSIDAAGGLVVTGYEEISAKIGAATAYGGTGELVVAAYDIHSFEPT